MKSLLTVSTLSTLAIFIALPLFSLHAVAQFHLSPEQIGLLTAIWPATVFCLSFHAGFTADRWGYLKAIRVALALNACGFFCLMAANSVTMFALGLLLFGAGKSFFDSSMRAAIGSVCPEGMQEKYFRIRYMLQNAACVIGPLIGVAVYKYYAGYAFGVSACFFMFGLGVALLALRHADFRAVADSSVRVSLRERLEVLNDRNLLLFIFAGTLILMTYGAYEALMPLVAMNSGRPSFGVLVSLNAVTVILFQMAHLRVGEALSLTKSIAIGFLLLILGFLLFSVTVYAFEMTLLATVVFSAGEAMLFPCFEVLINRCAPGGSRAAYFGAAELKQAGFFLGPLAGGWMLERMGDSAMFGGCAVCLVLAWIFTSRMRAKPVS